MKKTLLPALLAALALSSAPSPAHAQRAGEVALGLGLGLGVRTGAEVTLRVMTSDEVGVVCKRSAFVFTSSTSCGAHLFLWDGARERHVVAEVGMMTLATRETPPDSTGRQRPYALRGLFLNTGIGSAWHPKAVREVGLYGALGPTFFFAEDPEEESPGEMPRVNFRPIFQPLFFLDGGVEIVPYRR
jgi:hypothetical protein